MLNPDTRSLYTSALAPPPGMVFDEGIATTFSLDPTTLLSIPVHLALLASNSPDQLSDGIPILEAIRRLAGRITVYAQRGRLQVPGSANVLYGLLEQMVCEVRAPRGGQFHPKIWLLRFKDPIDEASPCLRLIVLSRNLTTDRSWDLALRLEGELGPADIPKNRELSDLIKDLPTMASNHVTEERQAQAERLASELLRTSWVLPPGYRSVSFSVLGSHEGAWRPSRCRRLAVVSPFCTDEALRRLARLSSHGSFLISRPETLEAIDDKILDMYEQRYTLAEEAETEDGESADEVASSDMVGLHAKIYAFERGWDTHLVVGSGNATNAALVAASNIEVMAELVGRRSKVGGIDTIFGEDGFGPYLKKFTVQEDRPDVDPEFKEAEQALYIARRQLAAATFKIACNKVEGDGLWLLSLLGDLPVMEGIQNIKAWPITIPEDRSLELIPNEKREERKFGPITLAAVTGLIAFELKTNHSGVGARLVLNIEIEGLPEGRDAEIYRAILKNKDEFFRYLLLLLNGDDLGRDWRSDKNGYVAGSWEHRLSNGVGLLEELTRAYSVEPERLENVDKLVRDLMETDGGDSVVTPEFRELWSVFETALREKDG